MYDYRTMLAEKSHGRKIVAGAKAPRSNPCGCNGAAAMAAGGGNGCGGSCAPNHPGPVLNCAGSIVQGNALAEPLDSGMVVISKKDCRPPVLVTCPAHSFFQINPDNRLIFFYSFAACEFGPNPSPGGCPTSYAQPYGIFEDDGSVSTYVDLPDGTYLITPGAIDAAPTFTLVDCPPASCKRYPLKWEGTDFVFTGPVLLSDLDVAVQLCTES